MPAFVNGKQFEYLEDAVDAAGPDDKVLVVDKVLTRRPGDLCHGPMLPNFLLGGDLAGRPDPADGASQKIAEEK